VTERERFKFKCGMSYLKGRITEMTQINWPIKRKSTEFQTLTESRNQQPKCKR